MAKRRVEKSYVRLNESYRFTSDKFCFILEEFVPQHIATKGKYKNTLVEDKWKEVGYFWDLKRLMNHFINQSIKDCEGNLTEIMSSLESMKNTIDNILPKVKIIDSKCVFVENDVVEIN